jgi:hypothetical protein
VKNLANIELDMINCHKGVNVIIFHSSKEVALLLITILVVCMVSHIMFNASLCFYLLQFRLYEIFSMNILNINF